MKDLRYLWKTGLAIFAAGAISLGLLGCAEHGEQSGEHPTGTNEHPTEMEEGTHEHPTEHPK